MRDQDPNNNWQLESDGESEDKWILQESEQRLSDPWELQSTPSDEISGWQPVEYVKPQRSIGSWLLPTVITIALLVVLGYTGYRVLPTLLPGGPGDDEPPGEVAAVTATAAANEAAVAGSTPMTATTPLPGEAVTGTAPSEVAPEETSQSAAPTAAPTQAQEATPEPPQGESGTVQQEFAIVTSPYGVNARFEQSTDSAVIRILDQDEELLVFSEQGEWLELFVSDVPLAPGEPISGTVGFAASDFFTVETRAFSEELYTEILAYTDKLPTAEPEPTQAPEQPADAPAPTEPAEGQADEGATDEGVDEGADSTQLTVTIDAPSGVNLRQTPDAAQDNVIRLLDNNTVLPALARNADTSWIRVEAPDGVQGWITADFVVSSGDLTALPVFGEEEETDEAEPPTTEAPDVDAGDVVTSGVEPGAPYTSIINEDEPAIIVGVAGGVNARTAPDLEADVESVIPEGAVVSATGRSDDGLWVQVTLPTGAEAWVFRDTVNVTPPVGALPAVDTGEPTATPPPAEPVLLPTPTPTSEAAPPESVEPEQVTASVLPFVLPVYAEPNAESESTGRVSRNTVLTVVGRTSDSEWVQVEQDDGAVGWVVTGNVQIDGDLESVAVAQ